MKVDFVKVKLNSSLEPNRERFRLNLPKIHFSGKGSRLLFIFDLVPTEDIHSGQLLSGDTGTTLKNVLNYSRSLTSAEISEISTLNFHEFYLKGLEEKEYEVCEQAFGKRIKKFLKKNKFDIVVFFGDKAAKTLGIYEKSDFGRVKEKKIGKLKFLSLRTLSLHSFATTNEMDFGSLPNLCGVVARHLVDAIELKNKYSIPQIEPDIEIIKTKKQFLNFMKELENSETPAIDTETRNLNRVDNSIISMQVCLDGKKVWFLPIVHEQAEWLPDEIDFIRSKLKNYFQNGKSKFHIFQNAKFDLIQLRREFKVNFYNHKVFDTIAGEFSLDENQKFLKDVQISAYGLQTLEAKYGYERKKIAIDKENRVDIGRFSIKEIAEYGSYDALTIWHIARVQIKQAKDRGYEKYELIVTQQMSDMIHSFVEIELNGININKRYLIKMKAKNSLFVEKILEVNESFKTNKNAIKVNKKLLKKQNLPQQGLFGNNNQWVFDISKKDSQQYLFFDVLDLKPISARKDGGGKIDKTFQKHYADVPEVQKLIEYNKVKKLKSTYIDGIFKRLVSDADAIKDGRLRADFSFQSVITGRAAVRDPGFQQIPTRGDLSKLVKEQFISSRGLMITKTDYKAHEFGNWGLVAKDDKISENLLTGLEARRALRLCMKEGKLKELQAVLDKTDPHIINVKFFFNKDVDKDHNLRYQVKSVVFGVMYGKGANSLSFDIKGTKEEAQDLIDKMFSVFSNGGRWIKDTIRDGRSNYIITSPIGRVRHLYGHLHHAKSVHAAMDRRGPNSIIQGMASDIGFAAIRILMKLKYNVQNFYDSYNLLITNAIHDANVNESTIEMLPLTHYLVEHAMTSQIHKKLEKTYGFAPDVGFDIDIEFGATEATIKRWNLHEFTFVEMFEKQFDILEETMHYKMNKRKIMKAVERNNKLICEVRREELSLNEKVAKKMLLFKHPNFKKLKCLTEQERFM